MRPLVFLSIATAKRLSHSCWASLSVAVPVLITIALVSWAIAPPAAAPMSAATSPRARAHAVIALLLVIDFPLWLVIFRQSTGATPRREGKRRRPRRRSAGRDRPGTSGCTVGSAAGHRGRLLNRPSAVDKLDSLLHASLRRSHGATSMKRLVLESTAPFQGLPELVAYDEGLFAAEGLAVEWADRDKGVEKKTETGVTSPKGVDPFASHGRLLEQGQADMYNACEWGIYCRVQDTSIGSRQVGRRAIVTYAAMIVAPDSPVYTPQQLANRTIGVPFYFGTHYIALHMLEGFLPRELIKVCRAPNGSRYRLQSLLAGEVDAVTLTEPHITLAEKNGCRTICSAFFHGTEVASDRVDADTYAAFNRAVREAVRRINANKRAYLHYFIDYHAKTDPEVAALKVEDLRESRLVVCDPAPIPLDEMERTFDWLKSWGMLEQTASPLALVNADVQTHAHIAAE